MSLAVLIEGCLAGTFSVEAACVIATRPGQFSYGMREELELLVERVANLGGQQADYEYVASRICSAAARQFLDAPVYRLASFNLGRVYLSRNELEEADRFLQQSLSLAQERHDHELRGEVLADLGSLHLKRGESDAALKSYYEAMEVASGLDQPKWAAAATMNIGQILLGRGDLVEGRERLSPAREWFHAAERAGEEFGCLLAIADTLTEANDTEKRIEYLGRALALSRDSEIASSQRLRVLGALGLLETHH